MASLLPTKTLAIGGDTAYLCVQSDVAESPFGRLLSPLCVLFVESCNGFVTRKPSDCEPKTHHPLETHRLYSKD